MLLHCSVSMGGFTSNTTVALFLISVPDAASFFARMVKETLPSPSGGTLLAGRKPAYGSLGNSPVSGSTDLKYQVTKPV